MLQFECQIDSWDFPTLLNTLSPLADTAAQRARLDGSAARADVCGALTASGHATLRADGIAVLQINVGKRCKPAASLPRGAGPDGT